MRVWPAQWIETSEWFILSFWFMDTDGNGWRNGTETLKWDILSLFDSWTFMGLHLLLLFFSFYFLFASSWAPMGL